MTENYNRLIFKNGETIFSEGDAASEAYLIKDGKVRLTTFDGTYEVELDTIGPGSIFGEMGVFSDEKRMASAKAVGDLEAISCSRAEFQKRLETFSAEQRDIIQVLTRYCQDFLPFELMEARPSDADTKIRDHDIFKIVSTYQDQFKSDGMDKMMFGIVKVLIGYAKKRLPPELRNT